MLHRNGAPDTLLKLLVSRRKAINPLHFIRLEGRHEQVFKMAVPVNVLELAVASLVLRTKLCDSAAKGVFCILLDSRYWANIGLPPAQEQVCRS